MRKYIRNACVAALGAMAFAAPTGSVEAVTLEETATITGVQIYRYTWRDSAGRPRTVSLRKTMPSDIQDPGYGGYAIEMTYVVISSGVQKTVIIGRSNESGLQLRGFGFFVSRERLRKFNDGTSATISRKIFGFDDTQLGSELPVTTRVLPTMANRGAIEFTQTYPRYGTLAPNGVNSGTGEDSPPLGTDRALFKQYNLIVKITWYFEDGTDYPRIVTRVDMSDVPGPNRVSFDVRGPYGSLNFDPNTKPINQVMWADRYYFYNTSTPLTRNSDWRWDVSNQGARFTALTAGQFEMGLLEPVPFANSYMRDGSSKARGKTSATYNGGAGCPTQPQKLPCDTDWPYQSAQYSLPRSNPQGTTGSEVIAWGSTPYYGTSLRTVSDGAITMPFKGYPKSKALKYSVCVVLGLYVKGGLTRQVAGAGGAYSCATVP